MLVQTCKHKETNINQAGDKGHTPRNLFHIAHCLQSNQTKILDALPAQKPGPMPNPSDFNIFQHNVSAIKLHTQSLNGGSWLNPIEAHRKPSSTYIFFAESQFLFHTRMPAPCSPRYLWPSLVWKWHLPCYRLPGEEGRIAVREEGALAKLLLGLTVAKTQ
jgi:hypothetical protein